MLSGFYSQAHSLKDGLVRKIAEDDILTHDSAVILSLAIHWFFSDLIRRFCKHTQDAFGPGQGALDGLPFIAQSRHRSYELLQQQDEGGQCSYGDAETSQKITGACPEV